MTTTTMVPRVEAYLERRRALGFQLRVEGGELLRFARWADRSGYRGPVTTELALSWAQSTETGTPLYRARRLEIVRCFARHQVLIEPGTEIPPMGILGPAHRRTDPYIYSKAEIAKLMSAARRLRSPDGLRSKTYVTLIGLLAATGLRVSEALRLGYTDVDLESGVVAVRMTKFRKSRLVPLHPSATVAIRAYIEHRDRAHAHSDGATLFVNKKGCALPYSTVRDTFRRIADRTLDPPPRRRRPRIYDLRHTFACQCLLRWYQESIDVNQHLSALSTYLGHAKVSDTYWYLSGVPELMSITAARFERFAQNGRKI